MQIVIRTDSSAQIGTGHVMRCLNLASYLKEAGHEVTFICRDLAGNIGDTVIQQGYALKLLAHEAATSDSSLFHAYWLETTQKKDAEQSIEAMGTNIDWLIVDHYALDAEWEECVKTALGCKLLVIDDLADRKHVCDLLLDQNVHADNKAYVELVPDYCQPFIGPAYALLKPDFFSVLHAEPTIPPQNLFIFFGGVDGPSQTLKTLQALASGSYVFSKIDVVCGSKNSDLPAIKALCEDAHYNLYVDTNQMPQLIAQADIAIGAGGVNTWERCFLHVPTLVVSIAQNQEAIAQECDKRGYIRYLGTSGAVSVDVLSSAIDRFAADDTALGEIRQKLRRDFAKYMLNDVIKIINNEH